jgi:hypothetical protein
MNPNETQQFLDEFNNKPTDDPFAFLNQEPEKAPEENKEAPETPEEGQPEARNRRERRLMEKLQSEREAAIALAARLEAVTEAQKTRNSEEAEFLTIAERIYGTQTPELREATELLKTALMGVKEEAKREALDEYKRIRQEEQQAVSQAEKRIDSFLEEIEDTYNVDISSGAHKTEFLKFMEKMSPKDKDGNIIEYADHHAVWEIYQDKINKNKPVNPAKDLAARAVTQSAGAKDSNLTDDTHARWLRENGII